MIIDTSSKNEEVKEVYAYFGLAIYSAQCLEHGLVNALIYLDLIPSKMPVSHSKDWEDSVDSFTSRHFEHTLGRMIKDLEKVTNVPLNLSDKLAKALTLRNWLAHNYFRERAKEFLFSDGRKSMIKELEDAISIINEADEQLSITLDPVLKKYGITEELIAKTSDEMLSKVKDHTI
ncbi:MAG: hypothetical protein WCT07_00870 [Candidatus Paceibacterota bacterium]